MAAPPVLPALRDDLALLPGPCALNGAPTWTIHDPVRNRFHRIGERAFALLSAWALRVPDQVASAVETRTGQRPDGAELEWMLHFLRQNSLIRQDRAEDIPELLKVSRQGKTAWYAWLLHRYLFFRIPLVRPDRFLDSTLWLVRPLFTWTFALVILGLGGLGLLLVLRQWQSFLHTFPHFFSLEGMAWYGLALVFTKTLHELGHAYTAKRFGCRVPTMGVAFLVMWPVLYTDTSDTWRLTERRKRLWVGAAGMTAELALALVATALWSFLPDGPARSAAFVVATLSWVMTLAVNLNPLMRFDGYYLLSDALGVHNLQDRAFALGQWRLREALFGLGEAPPEPLPRRLRRTLLLYAYATWIWRFFLFLGIALLVYHLFFKALGVFLFVVEIWWFILRPLSREGGRWWEKRQSMTLNRHSLTTLGVLAGLVLVLVLPWQGLVSVPTVQRAADHAWIFPPAPARLERLSLEAGQRVEAGQVLAVLSAPDLDHEIAQSERRIALHQAMLLREAASPQAAQGTPILRRQLMSETARLHGLQERRERLTLRAPLSGWVGAVSPGLHPGRWLPANQPLAHLVEAGHSRLIGYVAETERERLAVGRTGTFYPDDPALPPLAVEVVEIAEVGSQGLDQPALASPFGGPIAASVTAEGVIVPTQGVYRVLLRPQDPLAAPPQMIRGTTRLTAESRSPLGRLWRHAGSVLIRESGVY